MTCRTACLQKLMVKQTLAKCSMTTTNLYLLLGYAILLLLLLFVFIFVGVTAFTGTGTVGAVINSILVRVAPHMPLLLGSASAADAHRVLRHFHTAPCVCWGWGGEWQPEHHNPLAASCLASLLLCGTSRSQQHAFCLVPQVAASGLALNLKKNKEGEKEPEVSVEVGPHAAPPAYAAVHIARKAWACMALPYALDLIGLAHMC